MASIVLVGLGSSLGGMIAGPLGSFAGYWAGSAIGSSIESKLFGQNITRHTSSPRLHHIPIQTSSYGHMIPQLYGTMRVAGNVIWSLPIKEVIHKESHSTDIGGKSGGRITQEHINYSYYVTLAIAICKGVVSELINIWADSKLITNNTTMRYRFYKGDELQMPDYLIEAHEVVGNVPAYRGVSYIVIEDFPIADYGNRIPNFSFEVRREVKYSDNQDIALEDLIKSMVIIPGSGEFVYDTEVQYKVSIHKIDNDTAIRVGVQNPINCNNRHGKADALVSLDQLQNSCKNLEWVSLVVCWFGNSMNIANCDILPAVEYREIYSYPDSWQVADFNRYNAYLIGKEEDGKPRYGGTVSDMSVLRYLQELRKRGYKILFYPMINMDVEGKPWRGRLTGALEYIEEFFSKKHGYNNFILHYARLVKNLVDGFIIGSEMIELNSITDGKGNFPAVFEFINLAKKVDQILGDGVIITYAADWSEYHHTTNCWYNLDPLWACEYIDVVGIDAYFPLTDSFQENITNKSIMEGWVSGEGYDFYYIDNTRTERRSLSPAYAWKNIEWWWANEHINPNGLVTEWQPKSKKIWFTEIGFPSVDACSNQPNLFVDHKSIEHGFPRFSRKRVNILAQYKALLASERKWQNSDYVERRFIWTWDARPYPYWPKLTNLWVDGVNWQLGHWLNGKIGFSSLAGVIADLCRKAGMLEDEFDVSGLDEIVEGYIISEPVTIRRAIEQLKQAFHFDIVENEGVLKFTMGNIDEVEFIKTNSILLLDNGEVEYRQLRAEALDSIEQVEVIYYERFGDYLINLAREYINLGKGGQNIIIELPIAMTEDRAKSIARRLLQENWAICDVVSLVLPAAYIYLSPGRIFLLHGKEYKITRVEKSANFTIAIEAIAFYRNLFLHKYDILQQDLELEDIMSDCNITLFQTYSNSDSSKLCLYCAAYSHSIHWDLVNILVEDKTKKVITQKSINSPSIVGVLTSMLEYSSPYVFAPDLFCEVIIHTGELETISYEDIINGGNLVLIGEEIIQFAKAIMIEPYVYRLQGLCRGRNGTEHLVTEHKSGSRFILLDKTIASLEIPKIYINQELNIKSYIKHNNFPTNTLDYMISDKYLLPLPVAHLQAKVENHMLKVSWQGRMYDYMDWNNILSQEIKFYIRIENKEGLLIEDYVDEPYYQVKLSDIDSVIVKVAQSLKNIGMGRLSITKVLTPTSS